MKRVVGATIAVALALGTAWADDNDERVATARQTVQSLASQLQGAMGEALHQGGPTAAIRVCAQDAPAIAAKLSASSGWTVGRTSLRYRNPDNAPDPWEKKVLEQFEARRTQGEDPAQLEFSEVVTTGGARQFRYLKAIPTRPGCLACHGADLAPEISQVLRETYPADRATGFAVGELRGAFTLQRPLP